MKRDIVLAHKVVRAAVLAPKVFPSVRLAAILRPLYRRRQVADNRLKPHIQPLALIPVQRQRHAPLNIPRNGAVMQPALQIADSEIADIRPPVRLRPNPLQQLLLKRAQLQKKMLRFPKHRRLAAYPTNHLAQILGIKRPAASVALIPSRSVKAAQRADPLHIPIRQKPPLALAERLHHRILIDKPALQQP